MSEENKSRNDDPKGQKVWLDKSEAALYLNCSPRFVDRLIAERRISFHHFGKFIRISPRDLDSFAEAGRVEARR